jgi:hypothetical protein
VARGPSLGLVVPVADAIHLAVLLAFLAGGAWAARITFRRRLEV